MRELWRRQRQLALYLGGGVASAIIDVGTMHLLIVGGVNYLVATSVGFGAGLLFNYAYHAFVTFTATPSGASLLRYLIVVAINYGFTLACVAGAVALGAQAIVGKVLALPLVAASGFILGKRWIFATPAAPAAARKTP
jgi:putative flippase GtrA